MGFVWGVTVAVGHVQEVEVLNCYSRFATRCLKLANPVPSRTKKHKQAPKNSMPGQDLSVQEIEYRSEALGALYARKGVKWAEIKAELDAHNDWGCPFSETEEEEKAMRPEHRVVYDGLKETMENNHAPGFPANGVLDHCETTQVKQAFQAAVEHLLPGQGNDFTIEVEQQGGSRSETGEGAKREISYIVYKPSFTTAGGHMDGCGRGVVNAPWGYKLTPIKVLDAETTKSVEAAFAVVVDRLGLKAVGAPGLKLITESSGG